jgi:hypothetical protein
MWLVTRFGFFSVVQKEGDTHLTIRSRVRADLEELHSRYLLEMNEIQENVGTDYQYRVRVTHADFAEAMRQIVGDINYSNFKNTVAAEGGVERAHIYGQVWGDILKLRDE